MSEGGLGSLALPQFVACGDPVFLAFSHSSHQVSMLPGCGFVRAEAMRARVCDEQPYGSSAGDDSGLPSEPDSWVTPQTSMGLLPWKMQAPVAGIRAVPKRGTTGEVQTCDRVIVAATDGSALKVQPEGSALSTKLGCGP